jgi:hypothetical protein
MNKMPILNGGRAKAQTLSSLAAYPKGVRLSLAQVSWPVTVGDAFNQQ